MVKEEFVATSQREEASAGPRGTPRRVLIADDSAVIQQRLCSLIAEMNGLEVVGVAQDAQEAIQQHKALRPDIVILDIRMPGGGGISALEAIKKHSPETTVVVLTNYPYVAYRKRCAELGVDYFFDKSTEFEKVKSIF